MKIPCRGSVVKVKIATVYTTIAQVLSINVGAKASVVKEVPCLDDIGFDIQKINVNEISQEDITGELYFDPALAGHTFLTDTIDEGAAGFPVDIKVVLSDADDSEITGQAAGFGLALTVANQDAIKGNYTIMPKGAMAYPTAA